MDHFTDASMETPERRRRVRIADVVDLHAVVARIDSGLKLRRRSGCRFHTRGEGAPDGANIRHADPEADDDTVRWTDARQRHADRAGL